MTCRPVGSITVFVAERRRTQYALSSASKRKFQTKIPWKCGLVLLTSPNACNKSARAETFVPPIVSVASCNGLLDRPIVPNLTSTPVVSESVSTIKWSVSRASRCCTGMVIGVSSKAFTASSFPVSSFLDIPITAYLPSASLRTANLPGLPLAL
jgi:hypothetical protein